MFDISYSWKDLFGDPVHYQRQEKAEFIKFIVPMLVLASFAPSLSMSLPFPRRVESMSLDINIRPAPLPTSHPDSRTVRQYPIRHYQGPELFKGNDGNGKTLH